MRGKQILAVVASVAVLGALAAAPALAQDRVDLDEAIVDAVQTGSVIVDARSRRTSRETRRRPWRRAAQT